MSFLVTYMWPNPDDNKSQIDYYSSIIQIQDCV